VYGVPVPTPRDPTPSSADVVLTTELCRAGQILGIEIIDHLVIGQSQFRSLLGLGFRPSGE
jgi:DNA repair protein RadC